MFFVFFASSTLKYTIEQENRGRLDGKSADYNTHKLDYRN